MISKQNRFLGAILLVSGTTIGAGMLALPVATGLSGFIPSLLLMFLIWLFLLLTAFYLLEVNLRLKGEPNIISMVKKTLKKPGEVVAWFTYLLLLYALLAAYLVGCSQILAEVFHYMTHWEMPIWIWPVVLFFIFSSLVYFGTEVVDYLNRVLMVGLVVSYFGMIFLGLFQVDATLLAYQKWSAVMASISIIVTSFGFHIIIPTLTTYLEHDSRLLRKSIFIGSLIPFIIYALWQGFAMGLLPVEGELSLTIAAQEQMQITYYLKRVLHSQWIGALAHSFAFFAIITSLIGVALSLSDFLSDGLKIKKTHGGKFLLMILTFIPPLIFAVFYPRGFIVALDYAGIFVVILLALLPSLMAWVERYGKNKREFIASDFKVPGGKPLLGGVILLSLVLLIVEIWK